MKSLKSQHSHLAMASGQLEILEHGPHPEDTFRLVPFQQQMETIGLYPLKPTMLGIFQVNIGKMCNQVCKHCHVDAGPDRKEIMSKETMMACLEVIKKNPSFHTVDITGGAPELNPHFRWFVEKIREISTTIRIIVRCNLTIILANKQFFDLPDFFKKHRTEVVSSLPFYSRERTDRQRGDGVFDHSIKALIMLNEVGYGKAGSRLILNLVYNPAGAFLPPAQLSLEKEYKETLFNSYGIVFNQLFAITNLPVSRYLNYLLQSGNYEKYMEKLLSVFNPAAAANLMCRTMVSVSWDGFLYDCDFNQMLDLKIESKGKHITGFNLTELESRSIVVNQHCYGCTAGAGSSCGGAVA